MVSGCNDGPSSISKNNKVTFNSINMIEDNCYIPINMEIEPRKHPEKIFLVLEAFRKENPQLEIIDWAEHSFEGSVKNDPKAFLYGVYVVYRTRE
jgi:Ser-tRNA(Ala) deacylase AlaX